MASVFGYCSVSEELKDLKASTTVTTTTPQDLNAGLEIEKKWVIDLDKLDFSLEDADAFHIVQTLIRQAECQEPASCFFQIQGGLCQ